jgi:ABC-type transport system involved in multi-copper enzyme maturation permease subunit
VKLNLALYKRALLLDSRRFILYGTWLMMGTLMFLSLYSNKNVSAGMRGLSFLYIVSMINFWFILFAGVFGFSSAITEEKEEETIGLLVMTGISPFNFVLSKAGARFTRGLFLIASQIPFTIFAVTLGGVSVNQVYAIYITLISFMFFLTFFCTFISLLSANSRFSASFSFILIVAIALFAALLVDQSVINPGQLVYFIPLMALFTVLQTGFTGYFVPEQLYTCLILGFVFFFLTLILFNKFSLREPKSPGKKSRKKKGDSSDSQTRRAWSNSLAWKEFYFQLGGFKSWFFQGLIYLIITLIVYNSAHHPELYDTLKAAIFGTSFTLTVLLLTLVVSIMFSAEFKAGTHSSIFTLPVDHVSIFWSKLIGGLYLCLPSLLIFFILLISIHAEHGTSDIYTVYLIVPSFVLIYLTLTAYLSLIIRIGGFLAAAAIIFIIYIIMGMFFLRNIGSAEGVTVFIVLKNCAASIFLITLTNKKITEMKSR